MSGFIPDYILTKLSEWFNRKIGRLVFRKTKLRYAYKNRFDEIVENFGCAMEDTSRTCSLISVISVGMKTDDTQRSLQVQWQLRQVELLRKWYELFKARSDIVLLEHVSQCFWEFGRIVDETRNAFRDFFQLIQNDEQVKKQLRSDASIYPYFEEIYNETARNLKVLSEEAAKKLPDEFRPYAHIPLPRL